MRNLSPDKTIEVRCLRCGEDFPRFLADEPCLCPECEREIDTQDWETNERLQNAFDGYGR